MRANVTRRSCRILFWENKRERTDTNLEWDVLDKASAYNPESKRCRLCLIEKYHIIFSKLNLLNSRNELVTKCRHENKCYLANFNDNTRSSLIMIRIYRNIIVFNSHNSYLNIVLIQVFSRTVF